MSAISEQSVRNCNIRSVDKKLWNKAFGKYEKKDGIHKTKYDNEGNIIEEVYV